MSIAPGHDDMARDVDLLVGAASLGAFDDAAILKPDVADRVLPSRGIDDMAAAQNCQRHAPSETSAMMPPIASATLGASVGALALRSVMPPVS